jgi:hypothetical protein
MVIRDMNNIPVETSPSIAPTLTARAISFVKCHPVGCLIALAVVIRIPLIFLPLTYSQDIWRQADTASIAHNFFVNGHRLFYPQINWGGSGPGYVEAEFQLYPWLTSFLYSAFGQHVWLGRGLSLLFSVGTMAAAAVLLRRLLSKRAALLALAFFLLSPEFLRYSVAFMPEATCFFFYVTALLLFDQWLERRDARTLYLCAAATSLAILVKPTAINIGLLFVLLLVYRHGWAALKQIHLLGAAVIAMAPPALWYWHASRLYDQYGNTFGVISGGDRKFGSLTYWKSLSFYTGVTGIDARWIFGYALIPFFIVGLVVAWRKRAPMMIVFGTITIVLYDFLVARYVEGAQGIQYHIFFLVFAALAVGLGIDRVLEWSSARRVPAAAGSSVAPSPEPSPAGDETRHLVRIGTIALTVAFLAGSTVVYGTFYKTYAADLISCANQMDRHIPAKDLVVITSDSPAVQDGVPNNYENPTLFFHADRYGWSMATDQLEPTRLEQLRKDGARWFVATDEELLKSHPALVTYLSHDPQVGPGIADSCAIYRLTAPNASG